MTNTKCANCDRKFDDEVIKAWGSNICEECANELFKDEVE